MTPGRQSIQTPHFILSHLTPFSTVDFRPHIRGPRQPRGDDVCPYFERDHPHASAHLRHPSNIGLSGGRGSPDGKMIARWIQFHVKLGIFTAGYT